MSNTIKAISYGIIAVLSALSALYYVIKGLENSQLGWISYLTPPSFFFTIGSFVYSGYMCFLCLKSSGEAILSENLINESNTIWLKDVFFKYLFSFGMALAVSWIIVIITMRFEIFQTFQIFFFTFVNVILPILLYLDARLFDHLRCPSFIRDITILVVVVAIHVVFSLLCYISRYGFSKGMDFYNLILSTDVGLLIYSFFGYFFYDYVLFHKANPEVDYLLRN